MKKLVIVSVMMMVTMSAFAQAPQAKDKSAEIEAAQIEYLNARVADNLIKSIGPINRDQLLGRWRKVVQGPEGNKLGYFKPAGIAAGRNQDVLEIVFSNTDMSWLPQGAGAQLNAALARMPAPAKFSYIDAMRETEITDQHHKSWFKNKSYSLLDPELKNSPIEVVLEGDRAKFTASITQQGQYSLTEKWLGYNFFDFDTIKSAEYRGTLYYNYNVSFMCGLQDGNQDRLICTQAATLNKFGFPEKLYGYSHIIESYINADISALGYASSFVGFERVK
jgi:hypothetical protein